MAVTQLLARVQSETASIASKNEDAFDSILSFVFRKEEACEDFDWSPSLLELTLQVVNRSDLIPIVSQAFEGDRLLNNSCPSGTSDYQVYSEVRVNNFAKVSILSAQLNHLPIDAMSNAELAVRILVPDKELPDNFSDYIVKYSKSLQLFYATARSLDQEVITWWD